MAYPIFTEEAMILKLQEDNSYISAGENAGTQSLSRSLEAATLPLDCHPSASNQLVGLLIGFRASHKQDQTENYVELNVKLKILHTFADT
jgi:hypothetical protein